ncbi:type III secretion system outer membrane ring subunit SctC [Trinickia acidisoli]|uniref:type III secretion system outer membrane ring subunit SctC n=1 Tax=Trinickia acidisoli TaxID=2767482 RepID=UPI001A8F4004|nr:type III secretion system outer membrane ring subunit SctC [Trinickia acidisoli]
MKLGTLLRAIFIGALIAVATPRCVHAAPVLWRSQIIHIDAQGKSLTDVLRDLTASQGITASIASNVQGTVTGEFNMSPQRFLDTLASTFGFVWFYDGNILSISNANDVKREVVRLQHATPQQLLGTLRSMQLDDPRFPVMYDDAAGTILVNGPPDYVRIVQSVAQTLDDSEDRNSGSVVRIFKLKHAWADDHKVQLDSDTITVKGVASVLSSLYHPVNNANGGARSATVPGGSPNISRVQQMTDVAGQSTGGGLANSDSVNSNGQQTLMPPLPSSVSGNMSYGDMLGAGNAGGAGARGGMAAQLLGSASTADDGQLPVIRADPITNSVLVRDVPQRIDQYAALVDALDVRPTVIEIEAHIIEIDNDFLQQIGVDWHAHNSHVDLQTGSGTTSQNNYTGNISPNFGTTTLADGTSVVSTTPVGGSLTAVLGDAGRYLLARINASQSKTLAKIEATPKVATLDNVEAMLDNKTSFFVRVSGYTSADLYNISTGVSLRVLPLLVHDDGKTYIKLNVHIEDGQLASDQTVDTLPVITSSEINTEALVGQGQSLLIAGYSADTKSNGTTSVPGLSKIPLIGALFRDNNDTNSHMERVYLLTPRVISF